MALQLFSPAQAEYKLRSGSSLIEAYLLFVNTTQRDVNLYWIDYRGQQSFYLTLRPGFSSKVDTFQTHPWIFRDLYTGELMQVQHNFIYWPKRYVMPSPRDPAQMVTCRRKIQIHFPVLTLRESCLWNIMRPRKIPPVVIDEFCIPHTLKTDLKIILRAIEKHRFTA